MGAGFLMLPQILYGMLCGLVAGSFLATLVLRWPKGETLGQRSHCDGCGRQLRALELVPLLSFAALGGRSRCCNTPIDWRHPALELAAALIGGVALLAAPGAAGFAGALLGWLLLALVVLDSEHYWLPDRITLPLLALGLAFGQGTLAARLSGAALAGGGLLLLLHCYRRLRQRDGLGLGDVKLGAALGAWFGPWLFGPLLLAAALFGIGLALLSGRIRANAAEARIPFGACLAVAAFPFWLYVHASSAF